MATLLHTNPFLADPAQREAMLRRSALDSSYFEGARGLPSPKPLSRPASGRSKARRAASSSKRAKGS